MAGDDNNILSASEILDAEDSPIEEVYVEEWGGKVCIRTMSGKERDAWEADTIEERQNLEGKPLRVQWENAKAKFLSRCICDLDGKRLFTDKQVEKLGEKSSLVLSRLWTKAARMNGLTKEDVDELVGNLDGDLSDDST